MQSPTVVLPDAVDEAYYQSFAVGKAAVELMPSLAHLSADGVGDADGAVDVGQGAALLTELVGWLRDRCRRFPGCAAGWS